MVQRPVSVIPNPDPSAITSEAIDRRVDNIRSIIDARINGMEKAVEVFQADLTRVPTQLDRAIMGLRDVIDARLVSMDAALVRDRMLLDQLYDSVKDLTVRVGQLAQVTDQRFAGIAEQFKERDTRTDQRAGDTKLAVDAAFAAAKEATSKIEMGFTKSIDSQQAVQTAQTKATEDKISDLKDRMTALENRTVGITTANAENRTINTDNSTRLFSIIAIIVAAVVGIGEVLTRLQH